MATPIDPIKLSSLQQPKLRLDKLEEHGVRIILSKAIEKLGIIKQLLPSPDIKWDEPYLGIVLRMTSLQKIKPPEDEEPQETLVLKQVQKCRYFLQNSFEEIAHDLSPQGGLLLLKHVLFIENLRYYDNFLLKQENINLKNIIRNLKDKINEVKKNSQETLLYLNKMTQSCLEHAAVTAWAQSETFVRNSNVSRRARRDQNNYRLKEKEDNIFNLKEQCITEIEKEELINCEITNHLQQTISTLQKKFEKWTARYSEEVDALDIALLQLRSKVEEQQEKLTKMTQQYTEKQKVVDVLQAEVDERDRQAEIRLAQTKAAVIIQQWWRNILYRRLARDKKMLKGNSTKKDAKKKNKKK